MFLDECLPSTECLYVPQHVDEKVTARVHVSYKRALFARSFCIKKLYISSNDVNFLSFNNDDMEP